MNLRALIDYLIKVDLKTKVVMGFENPHSYRGYYEDLAFEPVRNTTVRKMLKAAKSALGTTYGGYKGGEYKMKEYTDVWLAWEGSCGEGIGYILLDYMTGNLLKKRITGVL